MIYGHMNNPISQFTDEIVEQVEDLPKVVKKQIQNSNLPQDQQSKDKKVDDKKDPVTGKPIPSKKALTQLNQATAQLAQARLKKLREDLDKQRLKITKKEENPSDSPEVAKPKDDIVAQTLKNSKSTGEFAKNPGG